MIYLMEHKKKFHLILYVNTSFSEEAFNFYNSMENNNDRFFSEIGTEPVPIFTNVVILVLP